MLQRLVWSGLISSRRGGRGGFELAVPAENISVLNVVEAIDGPIHLNLCVPGASGCDRSLACAVHPVWVEAQTALVKVLGGANMAALGRQRRTAQRKRQQTMRAHPVREGRAEQNSKAAAGGRTL